MSKKSIRTPEQQECRDNLAKKLRWLRKQWDDWRKVANDLYETLQGDEKYVELKWFSLDQVFEEVENSYESRWDFMTGASLLCKALSENKSELTEKQKEIIKKIIRFWFNEYSEAYRERFQGSPKWDLIWNTVAINFLKQNYDIFTQEEKEEFVLSAIKGVDISIRAYDNPGSGVEWFQKVYNENGSYHHKPTWIMSNWTTYYFSSRRNIKSMIEDTLTKSNNEKFIFDMLPYLAERRWFFDIPENCKSVYSDWEKFKNYIMSINDLLDEKRRENAEDRKKWSYWSLDEERYTAMRTWNVFSFFDNLWIKIAWDVADLLGDAPYYSSHDETKDINELSEKIIEKDSIKTSLNNIMENVKKEKLERFRKYFSSEYIRKLLDDKYKMPEFVNDHIDDLKPILDKKWLDILLQQFGKLTKWKELSDSEKFNRDVFEKYLDYSYISTSDATLNKIWKYVNLTTLNKEDFERVERGFYKFVEREWLLGTDYLDNVLKWHWYPKNHSVYYMLKAKWEVLKDFLEWVLNNESYYNDILSSGEATAFMQDIYETQDENLIKKLFDKIWEFSKYCSQEEVNILIRKMIKAISSLDDFKQFKKIMDKYAYEDKFWLFLKINYLLTSHLNIYTITENEVKIPSDIYKSIVASRIIDMDELPKVWPSVFVEAEDLEKLSQFYSMLLDEKKQADEKRKEEEKEREERLRKEEEETKRIRNEAMENRENWEVIFDDYEKDEIFKVQKYVLSVDREKRILKFISAPMNKYPYHANLHNWYIKEWWCLWWGLIDKDDEKKVIKLWWSSGSYWYVPSEAAELMKKMLEKKFLDYKIIVL